MPDATFSRIRSIQSAQPQQQQQTPPIQVKKSGGNKFGRILGAIAGGALNVVAPGMGTVVGELVGRGGPADEARAIIADDKREMAEMLVLQNQMQKQTQTFALLTNIMKAKHDAEMSAVHNLKS